MVCAIDNQARYPNMVNIWEKPFTLIDGIPKLPDILFNMICKPEPQAPTVNEPKAPFENNTAQQLCICISIHQFDN